jgi:hypothetical protein
MCMNFSNRDVAMMLALCVVLSPVLLVGGAVYAVSIPVTETHSHIQQRRRRRRLERLEGEMERVELASVVQGLYREVGMTRSFTSTLGLGMALMLKSDHVAANHYLSLAAKTALWYFLPNDDTLRTDTQEKAFSALDDRLDSLRMAPPSYIPSQAAGVGPANVREYVGAMYFYGMNLLVLRDFKEAKVWFLRAACLAQAHTRLSRSSNSLLPQPQSDAERHQQSVCDSFSEWDALAYAAHAAYLEATYPDFACRSIPSRLRGASVEEDLSVSGSLVDVAVSYAFPQQHGDVILGDIESVLRSAHAWINASLQGAAMSHVDNVVSSKSLMIQALVCYRLGIVRLQQHFDSQEEKEEESSLSSVTLSDMIDFPSIDASIQTLKRLLEILSDSGDDDVDIVDVHLLLSQCYMALGSSSYSVNSVNSSVNSSSSSSSSSFSVNSVNSSVSVSASGGRPGSMSNVMLDQAAAHISVALQLNPDVPHPDCSCQDDVISELLFRPPLLGIVTSSVTHTHGDDGALSPPPPLRPHSFVPCRVHKPTWCVACLLRIRLRDADSVKCTQCDGKFHLRCSLGQFESYELTSNTSSYCLAAYAKEQQTSAGIAVDGSSGAVGERDSGVLLVHHHQLGRRRVHGIHSCSHCHKSILSLSHSFVCKTCGLFFHSDCGPQLRDVMIDVE